ncbi:hypothetical protein N9003_01985 [bacterium]|nr:hypothetical protein [bacterium]
MSQRFFLPSAVIQRAFLVSLFSISTLAFQTLVLQTLGQEVVEEKANFPAEQIEFFLKPKYARSSLKNVITVTVPTRQNCGAACTSTADLG